MKSVHGDFGDFGDSKYVASNLCLAIPEVYIEVDVEGIPGVSMDTFYMDFPYVWINMDLGPNTQISLKLSKHVFCSPIHLRTEISNFRDRRSA